MHRTLYRFSLDDYKDVKAIWNGTHPDDGKELVVSDSLPEGGPVLEMEEQPESYAPGVNPEDLYEIAQKLLKNM